MAAQMAPVLEKVDPNRVEESGCVWYAHHADGDSSVDGRSPRGWSPRAWENRVSSVRPKRRTAHFAGGWERMWVLRAVNYSI